MRVNQKNIFTIMKNIIENIRTLRELKGYSQEYLADLIGVTQSAYARFERGATKTDLKTVSLVAKTLNMSIVDIITYPEKYINIKDASKELISSEPEVILQIKLKGDTRNEILKTVFKNCDYDILKCN